jgi:hypothetical protein
MNISVLLTPDGGCRYSQLPNGARFGKIVTHSVQLEIIGG